MRRKYIPKRLPKLQPMDAAEREYMRNLLLYQKAYTSMLRSGLEKILHPLKIEGADDMPTEFKTDSSSIQSVPHFDANFEKKIADLFKSVQTRLQKAFPDKVLRAWSEAMVGHVNDISKKNMGKIGSAVDLDLGPIMKDKELTPYFKNVVEENVGLIKSISQQKIPQFKNFLVFKITNDAHNKDFWQDIEKYIDQNTMSVRAHAKLIARDQVNKLNGKINQYRQQQLGGKRYFWRTSSDERVRDDHRKLGEASDRGKMYRWDSPPVVDKRTGRRGHPGYDYQCRCTAEMVLDDVIE